MGWFTPKPSVSEEEREWLEGGMLRLIDFFGYERLRTHPTILPKPEFFPDRYKPNEKGLTSVVKKVCGYMGVDPTTVDFYNYGDDHALLKSKLPEFHTSSKGAAGLYHQELAESRPAIGIDRKLFTEPTRLVATIAHELGHVLLISGGKIQRTEEDHEPLTDLLTVYFGLGIFTANSAFTFQQWQGAHHHGWSSSRLGYLSEPMFGYALAAYCWMKGEMRPDWQGLLRPNVRSAFKQSLKFLAKTGQTRLPKG